MAIQWGLSQQPNAFERAFLQSQQATERRRALQQEEASRNALASYVQKPNEAGFNALAQAAPEIAMQVQGQRQQAQREAMLGDLRQRAASGDRAAIAELTRLAPTEANSIASQRRQYEGDMVTAASNLAQRILTLPPEQRAGVYQQQIAILAQRFPELAGHEYSDELMQSTIAEADDWQQFDQSQRPQTFNITAGGSVYERDAQGNVRPVVVPNYQGAPAGAPAGPAPAQPQPAAPTQIRVTPREYSALTQRYGPEAVQQRMANGQVIVTVQTPDEARTLPSGTRILLPDGTEGRVP